MMFERLFYKSVLENQIWVGVWAKSVHWKQNTNNDLRRELKKDFEKV